MVDWHWITEMVKNNGIGVLLFVILFLFLKSQNKAWKEQRQADSDREKRNFEMLNGFLETLQCMIAQNSRMESKIESNLFCPMVRKETGR
jgi:hypothetical protein